MLQRIGGLIHKNFLICLVLAYILAGIMPGPGLWLRHVGLPDIHLSGKEVLQVNLSVGMLALLLFNAGLGVKRQELRNLFTRPLLLSSGFVTNLFLPVTLVLLVKNALGMWHNNDELQNLLVGIALIASMPVAGSSTGWAQNSGGNMSLSLGLVLLSTIMSPITTPLILKDFGRITTGDYSEDLNELAVQGTNAFMGLTVVLPSVLGVLVALLAGQERIQKVKPGLKLANYVLLLLLNYSNASISLPAVISFPDWDFLALVCGTCLVLCLSGFTAGWLLSRLASADVSEKASLMFGLGMNNNGTALVLASLTLADHPAVMLPMIFYTLVQQVIAATAAHCFFKNGD